MSLLYQVPAQFSRTSKARKSTHLLTAASLDINVVEELCDQAYNFESGDSPASALKEKSIALLFFQPSTRTRVGFQVATLALGCNVVSFENMAASRSNECSGETLEDCAAVISRLCDAIVVRHHEVGASGRMAAKSMCPVINAGDGWNEHPTQALIDIYALRRGLGTISGTSIAFAGDPRGRTVRSLILLLRHETPREIVFCPPAHVPVPKDLIQSIERNQIRWRLSTNIDQVLTECNAVMMAPYDMSDIGEAAGSGYVSPRATPASHVVTSEKIDRCRSRTLLFHPLPRKDEIHPSCDDLDQAMYFEQVRLSKFMRMAILTRMLSRA